MAVATARQAVEAFAADDSDPAFLVRVRVRRLDGRPDDPDSVGLEEGVEGARELRVVVVIKNGWVPPAKEKGTGDRRP